jgi:tetratricopeptide (TPR) repeat protein
MTARNKKLFQSRGSESHFLLFKTDTRRLKEIKSKEIIDANDAVRSAFPDMRAGSDFINHAMQQLDSNSQFTAMTIRLDQSRPKSGTPDNPAMNDGQVDVADILDRLCRKENGLWGTLEAGLFGSFFPEKDATVSLYLARNFQKRLLNKTNKTVTIGVASYPTITYTKPETINNARKALDHATFFGANSLVAFDGVSLNISGDKFYESGKIREAIKEFKRALKLDPSNVNVHNSLGVCYGLQNECESAIEEFQKAFKLDSGEYMALYNLGLVHLLMEHRKKALAYFIAADKINGNTFEVALQTGKLYLEIGNPEKGRPFLERAAELEPKSGPAYRYLADCHAADRMPDAAISAYKKAIKNNPHDAAAISALGSLFDDQGENPEITLMFLSESVAISPENGLFHHRLGRHFSNHNRLDDALKAYEKAKSLGYDAATDIQAIRDRIKVEK